VLERFAERRHLRDFVIDNEQAGAGASVVSGSWRSPQVHAVSSALK